MVTIIHHPNGQYWLMTRRKILRKRFVCRMAFDGIESIGTAFDKFNEYQEFETKKWEIDVRTGRIV